MLDKLKARYGGGSHETSPLFVGMVGISIPVILIALACVGGGTAVLVLAVIAMVLVGGATLTFVIVLATDAPESPEGEESSEHASAGAA